MRSVGAAFDRALDCEQRAISNLVDVDRHLGRSAAASSVGNLKRGFCASYHRQGERGGGARGGDDRRQGPPLDLVGLGVRGELRDADLRSLRRCAFVARSDPWPVGAVRGSRACAFTAHGARTNAEIARNLVVGVSGEQRGRQEILVEGSGAHSLRLPRRRKKTISYLYYWTS